MVDALRQCLEKTLSPYSEERKNAEAQLKLFQHQTGYLISLLQLMEKAISVEEKAVRQATAVAFKNFIKSEWDPEKSQLIVENDRNVVKAHLVTLMCAVPEQIQKQLSVALTTIGEYDFPHQWQSLLPELIAKLHSDWRTINGVLFTANAIFKRFRNVYKSDALYRELKHCLDHFQEPLLQLFRHAHSSLSAAAGVGNKDEMIQIVLAMRTMNRIFFSLNWQDLPAFFEDHISDWMNEFAFCLEYDSALLVDESEEEQPGPLELLKQSVVENLTLYADKYEEEFSPFLQREGEKRIGSDNDTGFTQSIWRLLSHRIDAKPKFDTLAASSMKFLKTIASQPANVPMFSNRLTLEEICTSVVMRNLQLRDSDEELFEDNPLEYIHRDIDESDSETRRCSAKILVRSLLKFFEEQVTEICLSLVTQRVQEYANNPVSHWRAKEAAVALIIAIAVQKESRAKGVSAINPRVPILSFFTSHIVPELAQLKSSHGLLKAACIKFVSTFRNQLSLEMIQQLVPALIPLLLPNQFVVHTYAASCIERILCVRDAEHNTPRFGQKELGPYVSPILLALFAILEQPNYPENDYLMKTVMRVLSVAKQDILPLTDVVVTKLTMSLRRVCANPSNPTFSHFLFESIAVLIVNVCQSNPKASEQFEALLFPPFQSVLSADVESLCPYVYQILALLLELSPETQGVSNAYMSMFPVLLMPALWERPSNVIALVKLIEVYVKKAPSQVIAHITGILGVFQKLISSRVTEESAFVLLRSCFGFLPITSYALRHRSSYSSFLSEILKILMLRLQSRISGRMGIIYVREFIYTLSVFIGKHGAIEVMDLLDGIQKGMSQMLVEQVWLPNMDKMLGSIEGKAVVIASSHVLSEVPSVLSNHALWGQLVNAVVKLLGENQKTPTAVDRNAAHLELEETGYDAGYVKLHFAASAVPHDFLKALGDPTLFFARSLAKLSSSHPGTYPAIAQQALPAASFNTLQSFFTQSNLSFS